jgi:hypothetical protein
MARIQNEVHDGEQRWMPWVGLALVVPAVLVLLVGVFGMLSGSNWSASGNVSPGGGTQAVSIGGAAAAGVLAAVAMMLGLVGLTRGVRRSAPHNGRSVGIAGLTLEVVVVVIAAAALLALALKLFL